VKVVMFTQFKKLPDVLDGMPAAARAREFPASAVSQAKLTQRAIPRMIAFSEPTLGVASTVSRNLFGPDAV
jgi:hypothetical protein